MTPPMGRCPAALPTTDSRPNALRLCLPGGARLEIADAAQVPLAVALLRALGQAGR